MPETPPAAASPDYTAVLTEIKNALVTIGDKLQTLNDKEQARNDKFDTQLGHLTNIVSAFQSHNSTLNGIKVASEGSMNNLYVIIREIEEQNDWMRYSHNSGMKTLEATMPPNTWTAVQQKQSQLTVPADAPDPTNMSV